MIRAQTYSPRVLELFMALPGGGTLLAGEGTVASGEAIALDRAAWVRFDARVAARRIADCVFRAWGCPHTLAAAAWTALALRDLDVDAGDTIDAARLRGELDAPAEKMGRLLIVEDALRSLLANARAVE